MKNSKSRSQKLTSQELAKRAARVVLAIQASGFTAALEDFVLILGELPLELTNPEPPKEIGIAQAIVDQFMSTRGV